MNRILSAGIIICLAAITSCNNNHAAEVPVKPGKGNEARKSKAPLKGDGPCAGAIETDAYVMKLHRAFAYEPSGASVLAGTKPRAGHKFIYLDVSLKNKSREKLEGGFLFIALRVTDAKGVEYKKPAAALAAYSTAHAGSYNDDEYAALWESFQPQEFHREVVYAVEVPAAAKNFVLHLPADRQRKEWKTLPFSL